MNDMIDNLSELARACNVSWKTAKRWTLRPDFPPRGRDGWPRAAVLRFAQAALQRAAACQTGEHADLKAERLRLECKRLRESIKVEAERAAAAKFSNEKERRLYVSRDEVADLLSTLVRMFRDAFDFFEERVKSRGDAELLKWAEELNDRAVAQVRQRITEEGQS